MAYGKHPVVNPQKENTSYQSAIRYHYSVYMLNVLFENNH